MYRLFIFFVTELLKDRNFVFGFLASSLFSSLIAQLVKNLPAVPGEGKGYSLQYSGLDSSMDRIVHGVTMRQT